MSKKVSLSDELWLLLQSTQGVRALAERVLNSQCSNERKSGEGARARWKRAQRRLDQETSNKVGST